MDVIKLFDKVYNEDASFSVSINVRTKRLAHTSPPGNIISHEVAVRIQPAVDTTEWARFCNKHFPRFRYDKESGVIRTKQTTLILLRGDYGTMTPEDVLSYFIQGATGLLEYLENIDINDGEYEF